MAQKLGEIAYATDKTIAIEKPNVDLAVKYSQLLI